MGINEPDNGSEQFDELLRTLGIEDAERAADINHNPPTPGEKAADVAARFTGSWTFILTYLTLTVIWCLGNSLGWTFDRYPFMFYTFAINVLSILMSALLLLASNRESALDRAEARNAYQQTSQLWTMLVHVLRVVSDDSAASFIQHIQHAAEHQRDAEHSNDESVLMAARMQKLEERMTAFEELLRRYLEDSDE